MKVRLKPLIVSTLAALFLSAWMGAEAATADDAHRERAASDHALTAEHDLGTDHSAAGHDAHDAVAGNDDHVDYDKAPITPNRSMLQLFLFSLILFWVFLFVARKLAWLPLIAGLDAREGRVNRALADAEAARIAALRLVAEHQAHLDGVTEQIKAIIAQARTDAEREKARIVAEAGAETTAMRDRAIDEIHAAREAALAGLDERIESQVSTATEHVLG